MNTLSKESVRVRNKSKGKRKKNKKVHSRKSVEKSSYEHIGLSSNNTNESFLSESSDTLNSVRNKFSSLHQTVLNKTVILLLSETKIDDSFLDSQFFTEGFKMYRKDRTKTGGGLLFYVNENLPGKIINSYKFKENFEIIVFEFSV